MGLDGEREALLPRRKQKGRSKRLNEEVQTFVSVVEVPTAGARGEESDAIIIESETELPTPNWQDHRNRKTVEMFLAVRNVEERIANSKRSNQSRELTGC